MNNIQDTRPGMPTWAVKIDDDSSVDQNGNPIVYYFGDGSAYLVRADTITADGVQVGPLEVAVAFGGDAVQVDVEPTTGAEMRDLADELYRLSYVVDAEQGNPVTPEISEKVPGMGDWDADGGYESNRWDVQNGNVAVCIFDDGTAPDLTTHISDSPLDADSVTRIVRALRAAEAYYGTLTARPNLRVIE